MSGLFLAEKRGVKVIALVDTQDFLPSTVRVPENLSLCPSVRACVRLL